jgi:uncharacterized protein
LCGRLCGKDFLRSDNLLAGLGTGAVVTVMWWGSTKLGYVAEHPESLQKAFIATNSDKAEAMSFVSSMAYTLGLVHVF